MTVSDDSRRFKTKIEHYLHGFVKQKSQQKTSGLSRVSGLTFCVDVMVWLALKT